MYVCLCVCVHIQMYVAVSKGMSILVCMCVCLSRCLCIFLTGMSAGLLLLRLCVIVRGFPTHHHLPCASVPDLDSGDGHGRHVWPHFRAAGCGGRAVPSTSLCRTANHQVSEPCMCSSSGVIPAARVWNLHSSSSLTDSLCSIPIGAVLGAVVGFLNQKLRQDAYGSDFDPLSNRGEGI